jgi:hypothetical protein
MTKFIESNFEFIFDNSWHAVQYDKTPGYLNVSNTLPGTKAIDFLAFNNKTMYLIEVKNFQNNTGVNQNRLDNSMDMLTTEIAQKVKDTVAVLAGIGRNTPDTGSIWAKSHKHIAGKGHIAVIAWVEEDTNTPVLRKRKKTEMATRTNNLKKKLSWLTNIVSIDNLKEKHANYEGVEIKPVE